MTITGYCDIKIKKIKKLYLTSRFDTDNISSVEFLLRYKKHQIIQTNIQSQFWGILVSFTGV